MIICHHWEKDVDQTSLFDLTESCWAEKSTGLFCSPPHVSRPSCSSWSYLASQRAHATCLLTKEIMRDVKKVNWHCSCCIGTSVTKSVWFYLWTEKIDLVHMTAWLKKVQSSLCLESPKAEMLVFMTVSPSMWSHFSNATVMWKETGLT